MIPETTGSEIVDKLVKVKASGEIPDEFTVANLMRDIKKLLKTNPAQGYMVSGMLSCLLGNVGECSRNHRLSIKLERTVEAYDNYITSLANLQEYSQASVVAKEAVLSFPDNIGLLANSTFVAAKAGRFSEALEHYTKYKKLLVNQKQKVNKNLRHYIDMASTLLAQGVDTDMTAKVFELSEVVLHEFGVKSISSELMEHNGEFGLFLGVDTIPETAAKMNSLLSEKLASLKGFITSKFTLVFQTQTST